MHKSRLGSVFIPFPSPSFSLLSSLVLFLLQKIRVLVSHYLFLILNFIYILGFFQIKEAMRYLSLCDRFILLDIMISRCIHVLTNDSGLSFLTAWWHSTGYKYHTLLRLLWLTVVPVNTLVPG